MTRHLVVKYKGKPPRKTQVKIPGWAGTEDNAGYQAYLNRQFMDLATTAFEILYHGPQVRMGGHAVWQGAPSPFRAVSAMYWAWDAETKLKTPPNHSIIVLPHPASYSSQSAPMALTAMHDCDWWPGVLTLMFLWRERTQFVEGEPAAQVLAVPRSVQRIEPMSLAESDIDEAVSERLAAERQSIATAARPGGDNAYSVLKEQVDAGKAPDWLCFAGELRKLSLLGRIGSRDVHQTVPDQASGHPRVLPEQAHR